MNQNILASFNIGAAELAVIAVIIGLLMVVSAIPAVLAYIVLSRIPIEHRKQSPGLAFLLLIPLFSLIWAFFVHPKVADSLKSYFNAKGEASDDCGASLALWLCICSIATFVPLIGMISGIAALVLLIMFYIKAFELSQRIPPQFTARW